MKLGNMNWEDIEEGLEVISLKGNDGVVKRVEDGRRDSEIQIEWENGRESLVFWAVEKSDPKIEVK